VTAGDPGSARGGPAAPKRLWLFRGVSLLIGIAVALALGELAVRALEPVGDSRLAPVGDPERIYGYPPNSTGLAGGAEFTTNALGLRGPERPPPAESDFVVAVLGDSYAFGYGVSYEAAFPAVLERRLDERVASHRVRAEILAFPGYNTKQMLATLREYAPHIRPDLVLVTYHLNDIERHSVAEEGDPDSPRGLRAIRKRVRLLHFVLPRLAMASRALGLDVQTTASAERDEYLKGGELWRRNQETLEELLEYCRERDLPVAAVILPYMVQLDERHPPREAYEVVRRWFSDREVPVTVAFDHFSGLNARDLWIHAFDGHPNAKGHALIADAAFEVIEANDLLP
jgi:lysophospholipase L1-like esterase